MSVSRPSAVALICMVVVILGAPGVAHADPAEPTDYRSEVVSQTPLVDGIEVEIVGGDAFVALTVEPGHEVTVVGYQGEPFIRVLADGRVEENRRSPSWVLSQDRFPSGPLPDDVGAALAPRWVQVAVDGTWVWHDHRVHWMGLEPPMGLGPGDQVVDGVVPLQVDGREVEIRVISTWLAAPSPLPAWLGAIAGLAAATIAVLGRRRWMQWTAAASTAGAALVLGAWQYLSLPAATGPRVTAWLLPATSLLAVAVAAAAAVGAARRSPSAVLIDIGAMSIAALELLMWSWSRRAGVVRAVLPTSAPWWLDRAVTTFVAVAATGVLVGSVCRLVALSRPRPSAERLDVVDDASDLLVGQRVAGHHQRVPGDALG